MILGNHDAFGRFLRSFQGTEIPETEKIFVHTDRSIYIAGDYIFFKVYVVDEVTLKPTNMSKIAYLSLCNENNNVIFNIRVDLVNGTGYSSIYLPDTLSTGYYQLKSFTNFMRNGKESSFFTSEVFIANQFDKDLDKLMRTNSNSPSSLNSSKPALQDSKFMQILPGKTSYTNREKISIQLRLTGMDTSEITNLSVSVFQQPPENIPNISITDCFLNGIIHSSLTGGDSMVRNGNFSHRSKVTCDYFPETKGQILQGSLSDAANGSKIISTRVFLSALDTLTNLKYTYSDTNGIFRFLLESYYDNKILNLKTVPSDPNQKVILHIDNKFSYTSSFIPVFCTNPYELKEFIHNCQNITEIHKAYQTKLYSIDSMGTRKVNEKISFPIVYRTVTQTFYPADYVPMPDFDYIAREIIPFLSVTKNEGKYECRFSDFLFNRHFEGQPLVFLDGILVDDINSIIFLGSEPISHIDCVSRSCELGDLYFDGVLSVFTKKKEILHVNEPNCLTVLSDASLPPTKFLGSDYSVPKISVLPDYRNVLYWNPNINAYGNSNNGISFFASDQIGRYIIQVEGITSDGKPISASAYIDIKSSVK